MGKIKVYELAKQLNIQAKELTEKLKALNIDVKNHLSSIDEAHLDLINKTFGAKSTDSQNQDKAIEKPKEVEKDKQKQVKKKDAPRIIRTEVKEIKTDAQTGIVTEITTEIKGDVKHQTIKDIKPEKPVEEEKLGFIENKFDKSRVENNNYNNQNRPNNNYNNQNRPNNNYNNQNRPNNNYNNQNRPNNNYNNQNRPNNNYDNQNRPANNYDNQNKPASNYDNQNKPTGNYDNQNRPANNYNNQNRPNNNYDNQNRPANNYNNQNRPTNNYDNQNRPANNYNNQNRPTNNYNNQNRPNNNYDNQNRPNNNYNNQNRPTNNFNNQNRPNNNYNNQNRPNNNYNNQNRPNNNYNNQNRPNNNFRNQESNLNNKISQALTDAIPELSKESYKNTKVIDNHKETLKEQKKVVNKPQKSNNKTTEVAYNAEHLKQLKAGSKVSDILNDESLLLNLYDTDNDKLKRNKKKLQPAPVINQMPTVITIGDNVTVKDFAEKLKKQAAEVIKKLFKFGMMATINQEIDFDTATIIAEEFGVKVEREVIVTEEDILFDDTEDKEEDLKARPPIVVVMGHVDHGKTSLLDAIRKTNVSETEAGGITQHIGAYTVGINGREITFLDTPGHAAFTAMRARGAKVTDVAILVVAADDGAMPQTIEAIDHAKAAGVPIIVAVNKIDKPEANPDRVKQELMNHGLVSEEWGGDTIFVPISAKKRMNIESLLEMVLLVADMNNLKSNPNRQAKGTVIEAKLDKGRGPVATVLVQRGTLNVGDTIVAGTMFGRVRAMIDDKGQKIKKAGPSIPVEIIGLSEVPEAGDIFYEVDDEKVAKQLVEKRRIKQREEALKANARVSLDDLFSQIQQGKVKDLNIVIKADVQGSVEAIKQTLEKLSNEEVRVKTIHGGVGAINESDVMLAQVSNAIIIGFNVRPDSSAKTVAERETVDIRLYRVIYDAIDDIQAAMKGMLEPKFKEAVIGHAMVRQVFKVTGVGNIAGCMVSDGKITRNSSVRLLRDNIVIFEGKLSSLKRFKDDTKEVATGYECGISIEKYNDLKENDVIEAYIMEEVKE